MAHLRTRALLTIWRVVPFPTWMRRLYLRLTCANVLLGVSALIQDERGGLLLLDHTYRDAYHWGMPGGYVKRGEPPERGLRREVWEETGLRVEVLDLLAANLSTPDQIDLLYRCRVVGGALRLGPEARAADYRRLDDVADIHPNQRALLEKGRVGGAESVRLAKRPG
jgi:8-oxo-dGTP pyrophosphatase MutT (NUDIX family)